MAPLKLVKPSRNIAALALFIGVFRYLQRAVSLRTKQRQIGDVAKGKTPPIPGVVMASAVASGLGTLCLAPKIRPALVSLLSTNAASQIFREFMAKNPDLHVLKPIELLVFMTAVGWIYYSGFFHPESYQRSHMRLILKYVLLTQPMASELQDKYRVGLNPNPCSIRHKGFSCAQFARSDFLQRVANAAFRLYLPVHLSAWLVAQRHAKVRSKSMATRFRRLATKLARSTTYFTAFVYLGWTLSCNMGKLGDRSLAYRKLQFFLGGALPSLAIFIESPSRRRPVGLILTSYVLVSMGNVAFRGIPWLQPGASPVRSFLEAGCVAAAVASTISSSLESNHVVRRILLGDVEARALQLEIRRRKEAETGLAEARLGRGDVEVLTMLLDAFFEEPNVLKHFSRAMYCIVIRHDHWQAFQRLQQRRVPISSVSSESLDSPTSVVSPRLLSSAAAENSSSKLPLPIFVAAEYGRHHILSFLLKHYPREWTDYIFDGHSLLSVAAKNGHYECVKVLLDRHATTGRSLDAAVATARRHRQAHVLVLLTSYLPEYHSDPEPVYKSFSERLSSNADNVADFTNQSMQWNITGNRVRGRGSIAETVTSEFDDDNRRNSILVSSPIRYNPVEEMSRTEEMRIRAEMEREQRQIGMMWLLDGREPIEEMQRRVDPLGLSSDGFAVLKSARDPKSSGGDGYSGFSYDEEAWYAVKPSEKNKHHDDLLSECNADESPLETSFVDHEDDEPEDFPVENLQPVPAPRSSSIVRSSRSHKLISVRSRGFQQHYQQLTAIEEHPLGESEA
ncbi:hypothetical protein BBO99_00004642 [Phytophthora kernoviae]|uniref:Uncharacterized protein n=1 Tax=Phytophthora kernoviae TaxID=325452 RepID=A0A3R7KUK9_9STRA|nr:hypothetical protein JM18_005815 [Phytophthora kernoviae]RLN26660.1 hypothetical protein BBI17_004626 [Phytophthora kernoviae]RLN80257.1 hypothetical protein BBO99_00004642 [Phytophthora kernoviae]